MCDSPAMLASPSRGGTPRPAPVAASAPGRCRVRGQVVAVKPSTVKPMLDALQARSGGRPMFGFDLESLRRELGISKATAGRWWAHIRQSGVFRRMWRRKTKFGLGGWMVVYAKRVKRDAVRATPIKPDVSARSTGHSSLRSEQVRALRSLLDQLTDWQSLHTLLEPKPRGLLDALGDLGWLGNDVVSAIKTARRRRRWRVGSKSRPGSVAEFAAEARPGLVTW